MALTTFEGVKLKKFTHDGIKVKKWIHNDVKVWSGASTVTYYSGSTILGTREVDEGEDVLHPDIDTAKSGYTLVGWTKAVNPSEIAVRAETLVATGEPIDLYAIYAPNSKTVAWGGYDNGYSGGKDGTYVSGGIYTEGSVWYNEGAYFSNSTYFSVNLFNYQTASLRLDKHFGPVGVFNQSGRYNGEEINSGKVYTYHNNFGGTIFVDGEGGSWYGSSEAWVSNLTLSNPKAWT